MNKTLIIIPTYDERHNVRPMAHALFGIKPDLDILFVDDNSPDGTGRIIDEMRAKDNRVHVIHKAGKAGLGRAYISGFKWAIENGHEFIFEMDADFSHDPGEIPNFLKAAENADMVLGSRYMHGIRITNWPLSRLVLSKSASIYVRLITGMPISDPTGGFKCYRSAVLKAIDLDSIASNGYSFQIEMKYNAWIRGFRITEIPITFVDRRSGYSKMNTGIVSEALWEVWELAIHNGFRRTPRTQNS